MTMPVIALLAEQAQSIPELNELDWTIATRTGTATAYSNGGPGFIIELHKAGWTRSVQISRGPYWKLYAELARDGARLTIESVAFTTLEGIDFRDTNATVPYFAPPRPPLGTSTKARTLIAEWEDRAARDDWDGWTATEHSVTSGRPSTHP